MPVAAGRICTKCWKLQPCPDHKRRPYATAQRSTELYQTYRWRKRRNEQIQRHPYCKCGAKATVADHITPHRGNPQLFWFGALQSLCARCSNAKTARERRSA